MDLAPIREKLNLLETQFGATGSSSLAQTLGSDINFIGAQVVNTPIGSIVPSMLTQAQFQAVLGSGWKLCNGQSCAGSAYATLTGHTTVPDARAAIVRGKNNGRSDGKQNANGELALGTYQSDTYGPHTHPTTLSTTIAHGAPTPPESVNIFGGGNFGGQLAPQAMTFNIEGPQNVPAGSMVDTTSVVGSEARPRSTVINYFIRVN